MCFSGEKKPENKVKIAEIDSEWYLVRATHFYDADFSKSSPAYHFYYVKVFSG